MTTKIKVDMLDDNVTTQINALAADQAGDVITSLFASQAEAEAAADTTKIMNPAQTGNAIVALAARKPTQDDMAGKW